MPTFFRSDDKPIVQFDPRIETSPFQLLRRLKGQHAPLLVDIRSEPSGRTFAGSSRHPGPDWSPPEGAEVVLFEKERYPVSARAVTNADVLVFPKDGIHRLLAEEGFRNDFIALLMAKQRYLAERIQELTTKDVEHRFFTFLRSQYGEQELIKTPLSKKDIAAAIGTTPESLSRLILRLTDDRIIDWQGKEIRILANPWRWLE